MEYRRLGDSGLKVSELALGTMQWGWTTDEENARAVMDAFLEAGGNLIDTADVYSRWVEGNPGGVSEEIIGRWMKARGNRQQVILATKVKGRMWDGPNGKGLSRLHIVRAVEDSLRRLQTDHIDLYQSHSFDAETPIEETMRAFDDLVRAGKVRYVGCSNYPAWRLVESLWTSGSQGLVSYASLQPHYNLVRRQEFEQDLADVVATYGLGLIPYSPLAGGFLTGKYRRGDALPDSQRAEAVQKRYFREENFAVLDRMEEIGRAHGKSLVQVALAWLQGNPLVTAPIIGANSVEQLQASLGAVGFRLDAAEKEALDELTAWQEA
jgi:aryl-alcohol dehydrogenase-like predicted oxidoreductase